MLVTGSSARAGGPSLLLGATEDAVRSPTPAGAKLQMDLVAAAGFAGVRVTQVWAPGERTLSAGDRAVLENVAGAAQLDGVRVLVSVLNFGSRTTPLTDADQADFAAYAASVARAMPGIAGLTVGNEPNLNRYWLPQFADDGSDAAAPAYESLLARTYDAVKAASPATPVVGGALSPRGGDVDGIRPTHSPTTFLRDMYAAYLASGRTTPVMDELAIHPYEDNSSVAPVDGTHPNTTTIAIADYPKLVALLGETFGASLPLVYDEFGVESQIPPEKQGLYTGSEVPATKPVPEATQAAYYRQAIALAFCQPTVSSLFLFHVFDEKEMASWQSGLYYVDRTAKSSLPAVRLAMQQSRRGVVAHCPGMELHVRATVAQHAAALAITCDLDCDFTAQLYRLPGKLVASRRGRALGGQAKRLPFRVPSATARYRLRLSVVATVNRGPATTVLRAVRPG